MNKYCITVLSAATMLVAAGWATAGQKTVSPSQATAVDPAGGLFELVPGFVGKGKNCMTANGRNVYQRIDTPGGSPFERRYYCSDGIPGRVRLDIVQWPSGKLKLTAFVDCPQKADAPSKLPDQARNDFCKLR
jgi:hypothetical protein